MLDITKKYFYSIRKLCSINCRMRLKNLCIKSPACIKCFTKLTKETLYEFKIHNKIPFFVVRFISTMKNVSNYIGLIYRRYFGEKIFCKFHFSNFQSEILESS